MYQKLVLFVGIVLLLLCITGCDERNLKVPFDPTQVNDDDVKRVLTFRYDNSSQSGDNYYIALFNTETKGIDTNDTLVQVALDDSMIDLQYIDNPPFYPGWYSEFSYPLYSISKIKLYINDKQIFSSDVKPVGLANAAFPQNYDYTKPLKLNWSVSSKNQYQFVFAESWDTSAEGLIHPYSSYVKQISNTTASYTFPANCVSLVMGDSLRTSFVLGVKEVNYRLIGSSALMVYQEEMQTYYAGSPSDLRKNNMFCERKLLPYCADRIFRLLNPEN